MSIAKTKKKKLQHPEEYDLNYCEEKKKNSEKYTSLLRMKALGIL